MALDDVADTEEASPVTISVLVNDSDADGDGLSVTDVTQGGNGSVIINADNSVTYTPNSGFVGNDQFSYTIDDGTGETATANVIVSVTEHNDPPLAVPDDAATDEDVAVPIDVLSNDSDPDGDSLTVASVSAASHGTVTISASNDFVTYTPDLDFNGTDSFSYSISDGKGGIDTSTVSVTVAPVNDAPVAANDFATTEQDEPVIVDALANDVDVDNDSLVVETVTQGAHGTVANNGGSISYTPDPGFFGTDSFTYTVSDNHGGTDTGTVTIEVAQASTETAIYVYDIWFESRVGGKFWQAVFEIRSDSNGDGHGDETDNAAAGVEITVEFAGQIYTGYTDADGVFRTDWTKNASSGDYAEVVDLVLADHDWDLGWGTTIPTATAFRTTRFPDQAASGHAGHAVRDGLWPIVEIREMHRTRFRHAQHALRSRNRRGQRR